ncbi:MAG: MBL fold metallo-hydrolase [Peptococcia bacterium]
MDKIISVANAGVLLDLDGKKVLIDGLCSCESSLFHTLPEETFQQIIQGQPPFDGLELLLITHHHFDHFAADKTAEFLRHSPKAAVVSNSKVINKIKAELGEGGEYNLIPVELPLFSSVELTVKGIKLRVFSLRHDGKQFAEVSNLAFLIEDEVKLMHVGDATASEENYATLGLADMGIDLFVAPFPYLGLPSARKVIIKYINPRQLVLVHFPVATKDSYGWIGSTLKNYQRIKDDFLPTKLFLK